VKVANKIITHLSKFKGAHSILFFESNHHLIAYLVIILAYNKYIVKLKIVIA